MNEENLLAAPFLKEVADVYVENESENLADYCFVLPNKRGCAFLTKYFGTAFREKNEIAVVPHITTISDLFTDLTNTIEPSKIEQLFILYNVYADILRANMTPDEIERGKNLIDFNRFQYWGGTLLNDFNDVDRYLVDPEEIFKNIKDLKEISSNFLTPEQIEVIKRYWNEENVAAPVKDFWKHSVHTDGNGSATGKKNVAGFVKLWQAMLEIYREFRKQLSSRGMSYSGMTYRSVCEGLRNGSLEDEVNEYSRYVFVGFSTLSRSEEEIFSYFRNRGIADFYWDFASPAFKIEGNRALRFMKNYVRNFPSLYKSVGKEAERFPEVEIMSFASTIGQVKAVPKILNRLYPDIVSGLQTNQEELVNTAIVLPDEMLSIDVLSSLPPELSNVNVTMGYSLRQTSVATLIRNIVSLQLRARKLKYENTFFYEDVIGVLSHPLIRSASADTCDSIIRMINTQRLFNIPQKALADERFASLYPVFQVVENANDPDAVVGYLERLLRWLLGLLEKNLSESRKEETDAESEEEFQAEDAEILSGTSPRLEIGFIMGYLDALTELKRLSSKYIKGVYLEDRTIFHLVERLVGNQTINFEGLPLRGLQIMGVLETRNLDFENVILLSMNERIFPRKHYSKTFIPNALRRGYGMATLDHQESIYAYYFYRLITRAKRVYLMYDNRSSGVRSGDPSRYLNQLKFILPAKNLTVSNWVDSIVPVKKNELAVPKTPDVISKLERYLNPASGKRLSASALNTYINCPLQFYLQNVEGYYEGRELYDYMDEGTYGEIIHLTVENMYKEAEGNDGEVRIAPALLAKFHDGEFIGRHLKRAINELYLRREADDARELTGDSLIFYNVMTRSIKFMIEREMELIGQKIKLPGKKENKGLPEITELYFRQGEVPRIGTISLPSGIRFNISYRIDRVDRVVYGDEAHIRLIDYKTGGDQLRAPSMASLFERERKDRPKALLQLLLYSLAYEQNDSPGMPVEPYMYKFKTMAIEPLGPVVINQTPVYRFDDFRDEFVDALDALMGEMFDADAPFTANPSETHCKYCQFKEFCGK